MISRIFRLHFALFIGLFLSFPALSQTLTISSATQTASSGATWQFSNNVLTVYGASTINASTIVSWINTSSLTIVGNTNAISVSVDQDIYSSTTGNGLTIGNSNSTGTVTFNNTVSLMGALTVYADKINMGSTVVANGQSAQLIAGGSSGSISLLARNGFETLATTGTTRGKIMTTGGGNIQINADTQNDNTGQLNIDWLTFDSGSGSITLEASSYSWSTSSSVELPEFYGTGAFTFRNVPGANHIFNTAWIAIFQNRSELTLGSNNGSEEIQLAPCTVCHFSAKNYTGATLEIAGPVNLYGSKVTVDLSIKTTPSSADILLKAKNSIIVNSSCAVTSNNGDITFWANADGTANSTDGDFIGIQNAVVINSANGSTSQSSGGGTITMAGGTTSETLASGTIVPTDYAYSNRTSNWGPLLPPGGINFGYSTVANGQVNSLSIYSGGGNIVLKGKSNSSSAGIQWFSGSATATQIMNSGNGTILFDGLATSTNAHGIELNSYAASVSPNITSSSSSSSAIKFVGETSTTVDRAGFQGAATLIANATGGGIEISGKNPSNSNYRAVESAGIHTYALTGPITFIGDGGTGLNIGGTWGKGTLPSSSSNIVIRGNVFSLNSPTIQTSGTITVEPFGNSFTNALSFPITNLTLPNTISGLTLGKSTNTANITFASNTSIAGPISAFGGTISVNQNLTSTLSGADVLLESTGAINLAASKIIETNNGDITFKANSGGTATSASSAIYLYGSSQLLSTGGNITLGGGYVGTEGNVYAATSISGGGYALRMDASSLIYAAGGNIKLYGRNVTSYGDGVYLSSVTISTTGSGTIGIYGDSYGGQNGTPVNFGGITFENNASTIQTVNGNIVLKALLTNTQSTATSALNFYRSGGVPSQTNHIQILSNTGNIEITADRGTTNAGGIDHFSWGNVYFGSPSNNSFTATGNITLSFSKILSAVNNGFKVKTTGNVIYQPIATSFDAAQTFPVNSLHVLADGAASLTIGKAGNTADITIGTATTIAGPITIYGGNISLNQNLITSGGGVNGDVLVKASGNIVQATTKNITTSGGDVTLWSDSDANGAGYIYITGGAASGVFSGGGNVFFGGGTDLATGYARGSDEMDGVVAGVRRGGIQLCSGSALQSGGGNITLRGQNSGLSTQSVHPGIMGIGTTIDAGNGKVAIYGKATGSGSANAQAISREGNDNWIIRSSNASADAIQLIGDATGCNGSATSLGINFIGTIEANGGGGILLHGTSGTGTGYDHGLDVRGNILANSGTITLKGENNVASDVSVLLGTYSTFSTTLGFKASTNVTASTSPIIIQGDNIYLEAVAPVNTTGSLTIEPVNTSFSSALSFPIANLTVASTIGGLTLGKSGNTKDITIGAATSVAGPINLYGNALILSGALSTTNLTTGNMSLNGTTLTGGSLTVANGRTLTMNLSSNTNYTGTITGTGLNFVKNGTGFLKLPTPSALSFAAMTISGGGFTLNPNQQLTLTGLLTNNGTFTLKDGATFLQKTSGTSIEGTGTFKVEKLLSGNSNSTWSNTSGRFWYMGVPMINVARSSYGTYGLTTNRLWSYAESTKSYTELTTGTALLSAGTGYVHRRSTNDTLIFSAVGADGLYRSDLNLTGLTKTTGNSAGYHLISNPYMAYVDWHAVYTGATNMESTYYIRSNNSTNTNISALISYNQSTALSTNNSSVTATHAQLRYIAPLQSIWVRVAGAAGSTGSLSMSRGMLSHQTGNVGLKSSTVFPNLARVNLVDGNNFDQLLVYLNSDMSNEVDEYDSEKMPVAGTVQVYTMSSNKKLVMNGLRNNKKKVSVPLYLELPETKSYTLQLSEYQVEDGLILLEDKQEGTIQDFTLMENYSFYANSGLLQNRFVLHFILPNAELAPQGPSNSWVAAEGSYTEGGDVEISNDDKGNIEITLNHAAEQKVEGTVFVTDMNGKEVYNGQLEGIITALELDVPSGIYYLTVQSGTLVEKKKVFIQE